jgi:hypothetical protein
LLKKTEVDGEAKHRGLVGYDNEKESKDCRCDCGENREDDEGDLTDRFEHLLDEEDNSKCDLDDQDKLFGKEDSEGDLEDLWRRRHTARVTLKTETNSLKEKAARATLKTEKKSLEGDLEDRDKLFEGEDRQRG